MKRARPLLAPLLAGARGSDRLLAGLGAGVGVAAAAAMVALLGPAGGATAWPLLFASIGASAVLVFAVPASPLAQPWPVIGGNVISALVGLIVARIVPGVVLAGGVAVASAIVVTSLLRCLHPPGGGTALIPVLAAQTVPLGPAFALSPVALNAVVLVAVGLAFHRLSGHSYPHRPSPPAPTPALHPEDIDAALEDMGETFDIAREDLAALLQRAERRALERQKR